MTEETLLIRRFNAGDTDALKAIYVRYKPDLLAVARALLNDPVLAEDMLHDVFVQFAKQTGRFRLKGSLKGYLGICVANRARNTNRDTRPIDPERLRQQRQTTTIAADPSEILGQAEHHHILAKAMCSLPDEQRRVVALRILGTLRFREIARLSNESIHTIQGRYRYGLQRLKSLLNGELDP